MNGVMEPGHCVASLREKRQQEEGRAWDALSRYKFWMFGYHAAKAISYGQILSEWTGEPIVNPFAGLVQMARAR